jgi:hypothetical protein
MRLRHFFDYSPATENNDLLDAAAKLAWKPEDNKKAANWAALPLPIGQQVFR